MVTTRIDSDLAEDMEKYGVRYAGRIESTIVRDILSRVLREHRESLERGAAELLEKEILDEHDLARLLPVRAKAATS